MFQSDVYKNRRNALRKSMSGGLVLLLGNNDSPMNYPGNIYRYRQDSTFLYFFGINHAGFSGTIDIDSGEDTLFGNDVSLDDIIWMGPQKSVNERAKEVGVNSSLAYSQLFDKVKEAISKGRKIHFLPPYRAENKIHLSELTGLNIPELSSNVSTELIKNVVALREVKEDVEIQEIEKACNIGYEMHTTSMRLSKAGVFEREIAGRIEGIALSHGGTVSFPVILSQNGETLHNHCHANKLEEGRLMLTDAGAETSMCYASDFTRTVPVGGKFSNRQKEIYQIVLDANNHATSLIKPGATYQSIHLEAAKVIASGLSKLDVFKGNVDEIVAAGAHAIVFPHGLGHAMGLDVHDMEDIGENFVGYDDEISRIDQFGTAYLRLGKRLKKGMVITNEPGIYFIPALIEKWKNEKRFKEFIDYSKLESYIGFGGIRLEDDILVTENGSRLLGKKRIPIAVDEIEDVMK